MERNWLVQPLLFGVLCTYVLWMVASLWRGYMWELMYQDGIFFLPQVDGFGAGVMDRMVWKSSVSMCSERASRVS